MKYIIVADDEALNQDILKEILMDDYEVHCVNDGLECIEAIDKRVPALLLLDISMPGMDGYEVCKKLRSNSETKNLPIVFLSGFASQENIDKGFEVGVDQYLAKPFSPSALFKLVNSMLED